MLKRDYSFFELTDRTRKRKVFEQLYVINFLPRDLSSIMQYTLINNFNEQLFRSLRESTNFEKDSGPFAPRFVGI